MIAPDTIKEALCAVIDPEVGINIVDMGLVYDVVVSGSSIHIKMTMTTRACPLGEMLSDEARSIVRKLSPEVESVTVEMVWDPPWEPEMMSDKARAQLGVS
ncbi:hypothetical protein MNBD_NITROSPINAE02-2033 [hydrothermal vent metagenome]|uniref:MIP18 family-like domain-containing protein n=1 Tax=hydrothermal vent metagenome TaxID=652676 RepID=A0A3B1D7K5_9ZZZZ